MWNIMYFRDDPSMIPPDSVCWEYEWLDVSLVKNMTTLSSFIQVRGIEIFRLGVNSSADGRTLKMCCFSEQNLLRRHFGVRLAAVECIFNSAGMVMEMRTSSGPAENCPGVFSASFPNVPSDPLPSVSTFTFHFYVTGVVDKYARERFDSSLVDQLWTAAVQKKMTDALIVVGEQSFSVHKFMLAARSRVFQAMFESDMSESRTGIVEIDDVEPDIFRQFLRFVYTGQLDGPLSPALRYVAHKYDVSTLEALCEACVGFEGLHSHLSEEDDVVSSVLLMCPLNPTKSSGR